MDSEQQAVAVVSVAITALLVGGLFGYIITYEGVHKIGRERGIVFCSETPKDCKLEYDYMKYIGNKKSGQK